MSLILGIDLETSGLDPKKDRIVELGAVLYDWELQIPVQMISKIIDPAMENGEFKISEESEELTGISDHMLGKYGAYEKDVLVELQGLSQFADYRMGHFCNDFDALFMIESYARTAVEEPSLTWLDTSIDIRYPEHIKTRNLKHLAAEHGFLNPFPHRAVFDVLTMLRIASCYKLEDIIARSKEPTVYVQALVSFEEKDFAKDRGYRWCAPRKIWWRSWKLSDYEADKMECGFRTQLLPEAPE